MLEPAFSAKRKRVPQRHATAEGCAIAATLCCARAGQGQASTEPLEGLAWVVQVSDLHLSAFNYLPDQYAHFGDKEGDLRCVRAHTWLRNKVGDIQARAGTLWRSVACLLSLTCL